MAPHIELSLSTRDGETACRTWAAPVRESADACLVLDARGVIYATSPSCRALLGLPDDVDVQGRVFLDGSVKLVTFSASAGALPRGEIERIPPLQSLSTGALSRGLMRVMAGDVSRTLDAIATPLHEGTDVSGSLTFFRRC
ncbi:MAG: hypothetical protein ACRDXX_18790 [Stackebrandtia sp.]